MERRRHREGSAFESAAGYSRAVRAGALIAVSGTAATAADGSALAPGDAHAQTAIAIERALAAVAARRNACRRRAHAHAARPRRRLARRGACPRRGLRGHRAGEHDVVRGGFIPEGVLVEIELDAVVDEP